MQQRENTANRFVVCHRQSSPENGFGTGVGQKITHTGPELPYLNAVSSSFHWMLVERCSVLLLSSEKDVKYKSIFPRCNEPSSFVCSQRKCTARCKQDTATRKHHGIQLWTASARTFSQIHTPGCCIFACTNRRIFYDTPKKLYHLRI